MAETPTDEDILAIEIEVGMSAGAWDMVPPSEIIAACWKRLDFLRSAPPLTGTPNE